MAASKEVTQVQRLERPFRPLPGPAVEDFKLCLQNIDWGVTLKGLSAEEMYNKFHNVFIGWMNIYLPMRNSRTNNFKNYHKPKGLRNWYTPQLAKMKEMVMSLFNISQATEDPRDAKNYKLAKINYKSALKQAKFHANQEFIQSSSNTCKAAWQIIKHETQPKQQQHATPDADSFNEYFISVVDEIREKIPAANTKPDELLEVQHLPLHQSFAWQPIEAGMSTTDAVGGLVSGVLAGFDAGFDTCAVLCDLSKAFDLEITCVSDSDCPSQTACINSECVNPCNATEPCGVNTRCQVFDTPVWRTMVCECLPGYQGNAAVRCDLVPICAVDKGYIIDEAGNCVCPPGTALNANDECVRCLPERGQKVDERGRCVCALERGMIIDERGNCVCPTEFGYKLDANGNCVPGEGPPECETDDDCADHRYCNLNTKTCDDPCLTKVCGINAFCNATRHRAICQCIHDAFGDPEVACNTTHFRTDFPRPDMVVSCLSDGVQVEIHITEKGFNGVLYVKGHSKDEQCRRVVTLPSDSLPRTEIFKVNFGSCGLIHVNGQASFVLVIQKHPKLVTYKAQAYHIKCVYTTGEQNVTLGFNVSMLTTAGTIANTGPPPTCSMRIVTHTGQEINSAEIGDNLMLQVDVQPSSIYGGFARSCVAKTMEDSVENEYIVTDENGCATDPSIFGEWDYNPETQSLLAGFNAFKFPSSDNIRFQCNIRVCFGKCQPVNCRGYNAYGRRRRAIDSRNNTAVEVAEAVTEGQLREEITLLSNAILTFERREERYTSPTEAPDIQQVEDICVSMIGFIIALIMTALLALVAVAVAVSCWLIAYRRRPKVSGPLPHPPEFPNPLFTTPEPLAEPSPDYLS
ncbi:hypothetical protein J6590_031385 [Homalodisca vitripennis]|nr:hypothetical protein J6590_031385 [Homalodisca vitripennis]